MFSDGGSSTSEKSQKQGTATHLGGRPSASGGGNVTSTGGASSGFGLKGDLPDAGRQKPSPPEPTPYTPAASKASGSLGVTQSQQRSYDIDSDDSSDDKSPQRPVAPGPPGPAPYPPRPSIRHQPLVSGRDDSSDDDSLDDRSPSLPPASIAPLSGKDSLARQHPQTTSETSRFDHGADSPSDVSSSWGGGGGGARGREGSGSGGQIAGGGGLRPSAPDPRSAMRRPAPTAVYRDDYPRDDGAGSDYSQDEYSDEILGRSSGGGVGRSGGGRAPPLPHGDNMDGPKVSRMAGPTGGKGPSVPPPPPRGPPGAMGSYDDDYSDEDYGDGGNSYSQERGGVAWEGQVQGGASGRAGGYQRKPRVGPSGAPSPSDSGGFSEIGFGPTGGDTMRGRLEMAVAEAMMVSYSKADHTHGMQDNGIYHSMHACYR